MANVLVVVSKLNLPKVPGVCCVSAVLFINVNSC